MQVVNGNLIDLAIDNKFDVIVHGCNCFHTFGSGIAREIKNRIPGAFEADKQTVAGDRNKLGTYTWFNAVKHKFSVVNAYTQYRFGGNQDHFQYDNLEKVLYSLVNDFGDSRFGFPLIGMGLANGSPDKILNCLLRFEEKLKDARKIGNVTIVVLKD